MTSDAVDTAAVLSSGEGRMSSPSVYARNSAMATTNRPRKRRSVTLLDEHEDEEGAAAPFCSYNPNPTNTEAEKTRAKSEQRKQHGGDEGQEEQQVQRHSDTSTLHKAKSCLALCSGNKQQQSESDSGPKFPMLGAEIRQDADAAINVNEVDIANNDDGPVLQPSLRRRIKRTKSEPSIVVLAEDVLASCDDTSKESSVGLDGMKQLDLENHDKLHEQHQHQLQQQNNSPDSAVISVDGSNESSVADHHAQQQQHDQMPLHQTQAQEEGVADVDVPSTPAYAVPPHPDTCPADMDPDTFVRGMVHSYLGYEPQIRSGLSLPSPDFFPPITEEDMAAYDTDIVAAVRENKMDQIRSFHETGRNLSCCNRFGESLIHMACRRGYADVVTYLLEEADVSVRIRDDCGRTPLTDACWNRDCQYEIVDSIIRIDPSLLCVSDKRGHTPFAYARREHWGVWRQFLFDRTEWIVAGFARKEIVETFGGADDQ